MFNFFMIFIFFVCSMNAVDNRDDLISKEGDLCTKLLQLDREINSYKQFNNRSEEEILYKEKQKDILFHTIPYLRTCRTIIDYLHKIPSMTNKEKDKCYTLLNKLCVYSMKIEEKENLLEQYGCFIRAGNIKGIIRIRTLLREIEYTCKLHKLIHKELLRFLDQKQIDKIIRLIKSRMSYAAAIRDKNRELQKLEQPIKNQGFQIDLSIFDGEEYKYDKDDYFDKENKKSFFMCMMSTFNYDLCSFGILGLMYYLTNSKRLVMKIPKISSKFKHQLTDGMYNGWLFTLAELAFSRTSHMCGGGIACMSAYTAIHMLWENWPYKKQKPDAEMSDYSEEEQEPVKKTWKAWFVQSIITHLLLKSALWCKDYLEIKYEKI